MPAGEPLFQGGSFVTGELAGVASATQCPDIPCRYVKFKAGSTNTGTVWLGKSSSVTAGDGSTDTTSGYPLTAGQEHLMEVSNLNQVYRICTGTGDEVSYYALVG